MKMKHIFAFACLSQALLAIDDLDVKTAREVLEQETGDLIEYYDESFFSTETKETLDAVAEGELPDSIGDESARSITSDIKKLYEEKITPGYVFNPSKESSEYRVKSQSNYDYVYFYLLLGLLDKYGKDLPDLDTSEYACKKGEYFKEYSFSDRSKHYWNEHNGAWVPRDTSTPVRTRHKQKKKEQKDVEKEKYDSGVKNIVNTYINDCYQNYDNFKEAVKSPLNFNEQIVKELTPYFKDGGDPCKPKVNAEYHLLHRCYQYRSPFSNDFTDVRKFKVHFDMIYNIDTLKKLFDEKLITLEDAATISKNNEEMAKYLLKVLKANKKKLTTPEKEQKKRTLKNYAEASKENEMYLKESRDRNARYKKLYKGIEKTCTRDTKTTKTSTVKDLHLRSW